MPLYDPGFLTGYSDKLEHTLVLHQLGQGDLIIISQGSYSQSCHRMMSDQSCHRMGLTNHVTGQGLTNHITRWGLTNHVTGLCLTNHIIGWDLTNYVTGWGLSNHVTGWGLTNHVTGWGLTNHVAEQERSVREKVLDSQTQHFRHIPDTDNSPVDQLDQA